MESSPRQHDMTHETRAVPTYPLLSKTPNKIRGVIVISNMHLFLGKPKAVNEVLLALIPARFDSTSHFIINDTKLMIIKVIIRVLESNHNTK